MKTYLIALTLAGTLAAPALAGGPTGRWTCLDTAEKPLLELTIDFLSGGATNHSYVSQAVNPPAKGEADTLSGSGGFDMKDGYYKPVGGPLGALGLVGRNDANKMVFAKGHASFMSCTR